MHKILRTCLCLCLLLALLPAFAQDVPSRYETAIAWGADTNTWAVPALQNGRLLSLQVTGVTNAATLAVKHLIPFDGGVLTNTVETALAADTLTCYVTEYAAAETHTYGITNGVTGTYVIAAQKPVLLVPGDFLTFDLSATNTAAAIVITTGVR